MPEAQCWILVLEDNAVQRAVCEKVLQAGGYRVSGLSEADTLLSKVAELPLPALLLIDIELPGIHGIEALQRLETDPRWCTVPAILMTATPAHDRVLAAQRLPVPPEGFLVKPFKSHELIVLIRSILAAKEPTLHMRRLQRQRLQLRIQMDEDVRDIEKTLRGTAAGRSAIEARLAVTRRRIQELRTAVARLGSAPEETRRAIQLRIRELEGTLSTDRGRLVENESQHRDVVRKRQELLIRQRALQELEKRISALSQVIQCSTPTKARD